MRSMHNYNAFLMSLATVFCSLVATGHVAAQTLVNGNFESGTASNPPAGWLTYIQASTSGAWSLQTSSPPQGSRYQQSQTYNASRYSGIRQNITGLVSGSVYSISGSYKTNSNSATASVRYNLSGNADRANSTILASTVATEWGTFNGSVTASGTSFMLFLDNENGTSTNKASGFDNIKIKEIIGFTNADFEGGFTDGVASGWTKYGTCGTWAADPINGGYAQKVESGSSGGKSLAMDGGIYQRFGPFPVGAAISVKADVYSGGANNSTWIKVDVNGGTAVPTYTGAIGKVSNSYELQKVAYQTGTVVGSTGYVTIFLHSVNSAGLNNARWARIDNVMICINGATPGSPAGASNNSPVASGGTVTLTATGASDSLVEWRANTCKTGTIVGYGRSLSLVPPDGTTTYYANGLNACGNLSAACASTTVTVNCAPLVAPTSASNNGPICAGSNAILSYAGGSGTVLKWYGNSSCTTYVGQGQDLNVGPLSTNTQYWARWENACGNSNTVTTTITVNPLPAAPTSASSNTRCGPGTVAFQVTPASGCTVKWYTAPTSGSAISSANPYSPNLSATTTYYAASVTAAGCESTTRTPCTGTVNTPPADKTVTASPTSVCPGGTTTITVASSDSTVSYQLQKYNGSVWVNDGQAQNGNGSNQGFVTGAIITSTQFQIVATKAGCSTICTNKPSITIIPPPTDRQLSVSDSTVCYNGSATITVQDSEIGVSYQLQTEAGDNVGPAQNGNGGTQGFDTGALVATTQFKIVATRCSSVTLSDHQTITVRAVPTATVGTDQTIVAGGTTEVLGGNTPTSPATGTWSIVDGGDGVFSPDNTTPNATFTDTAGTGPVTLRWTVSNPPCESASADMTVTVNPAGLRNGDFEDGFTDGVANGWTKWIGTIDSWESAAGYEPTPATSQKTSCVTKGGSGGGIYQQIGAPAGTIVTVSAHVQAGSANNQAWLIVVNGAATSSDYIDSTCRVNSSSWTRVSHPSITVGSSGVFTIILKHRSLAENERFAYFDNVTVCYGNVPDAPTDVTNSGPICSGSTATLTATPAADSYVTWLVGGCDGAVVGTGSSINVSPTVNTAYFARSDNGCLSSTCVATTVMVHDAFSVGSISGGGDTFCKYGDPANMTYGGGPGEGTIVGYQWYSRPGTSGPGTEDTLIDGATSASYDPPPGLAETTTYNVLVTPTCGTAAFSLTPITVTVNSPSISGQITLDGFVGTSRAVTFVATGGPMETWTKTLSFTNGVADYILMGIPEGTTGLSAKTAWSLRQKRSISPDDCQTIGIDFTLPSGDLNGSNSINIEDYVILKTKWFTHDTAADVNGDGDVNTADYSIMKTNWFRIGSAE